MARVRSRFTAAAGVGLAAVLGVASCGQVQQLSAKDQVSEAMSGLDSAKSATFTMSIDGTAAGLLAIAEAQGEAPADGQGMQDQVPLLEQVLASDIVLTMVAPAGKTFGELTSDATASQDVTTLLDDPAALKKALENQGNSAFAVRQGGSELIDLRLVDGVFYARADVKKVLTLVDEDADFLDQELTGLPPALAPLADAAEGKWVSLDLAAAMKAANDSGLMEALPTAAPTPTLDAAKLQKLLDSLQAAYQSQATITELGADDERGDGFRLAAPAKQVAQAVSDDLIALVGTDFETEIREAITSIPDKTFAMDLWVKDDKLSAVSLDLIQFMEKPVTGQKLAIDIDIDIDSGAIEAPSGATAIDVQEMLNQLPTGALTGGIPTEPGGGSEGALSDEELKQLQEATGMSDEELQELIG